MNIKQFNSKRKSLNRSMSEYDDFFEAFGKLDDSLGNRHKNKN